MNNWEQMSHYMDSTAQHMLYCAIGFCLSTIVWLALGVGILLGRWRRRSTEVKPSRSNNESARIHL
jgi:hypothetical protein